MSTSASTTTGNAKSFLAARLRRRQQMEAAPQLRWERRVVASIGSELHPEGAPVVELQLVNDGGTADQSTIVLFTGTTLVRDQAGDAGQVSGGDRWNFLLDEIDLQPSERIWGYALGRGGDGRWFATTIDGRSASFRSMPDEIGVLRTLGLRMPPAAVPEHGSIRCERVAAPATA